MENPSAEAFRQTGFVRLSAQRFRQAFMTVITACSRVICARGAKEPFAWPFIRPAAVTKATPPRA